MKCWFWEQLIWTKGKEWRGLGHWAGQRQCLAKWFLLKGWQWVRFGVIVLLDRIWKSRKWNENSIHIQMETSPHVHARFSIIEDMYIYVCSKGNWTGWASGIILLTVWGLCLYCCAFKWRISIYVPQKNMCIKIYDTYIVYVSYILMCYSALWCISTNMFYYIQCIKQITNCLLLYPMIIFISHHAQTRRNILLMHQ